MMTNKNVICSFTLSFLVTDGRPLRLCYLCNSVFFFIAFERESGNARSTIGLRSVNEIRILSQSVQIRILNEFKLEKKGEPQRGMVYRLLDYVSTQL